GPVYATSGLFIMLLWIKYGLIGLGVSFLILLIPLILCSKSHFRGARKYHIEGYGGHREGMLFKLLEKIKTHRNVLLE
ncbi:MAG: hypothetical protein KAQ92_03175, partial [Candidatus Aenigmarchaeota archaeon]|nr:hypothetical protein [Candidatus Aenigmarchaeota archaeon]